MRWHSEHAIVNDVSVVLKLLTAFFQVHAEIYGDATVSAIEPEDTAELVALLIERDADFAVLFCGSLFEFVHFLMDKDRWSGTPESYQAVRCILYNGLLSARFLPEGWPGKRAANIHHASRNGAGASRKHPPDLRERHPNTRQT
ncbi:hypothetical protein ASG71_00670 [Arthrobacter sp. Soil763]|nr:hypothetical protein ASG71_00670 [Arthrobacter sp. Soil763]